MNNTCPHPNPSDVFFAQEILDFNSRPILPNNDVDWEIHNSQDYTEKPCQNNDDHDDDDDDDDGDNDGDDDDNNDDIKMNKMSDEEFKFLLVLITNDLKSQQHIWLRVHRRKETLMVTKTITEELPVS
eukprot:XP_017455903.1 PREDICTED: calsequestrin-1-like [Rattus norvegicus]